MKTIKLAIEKALKKLDLPNVDFTVDHPKDETHGDYASNIAMAIFGGMQKNKSSDHSPKIAQGSELLGAKNPRELAEKIVTSLQNDAEINRLIDKIEVAGPPTGGGFINFYLKEEWLVKELHKATVESFGTNIMLAGKKVVVEYTDPNPFKEFHIGHLMSNTIGESLAKLFETQGAEVKRVNYQGDVGLHVAKSVWGMIRKLEVKGIQLEEIAQWNLQERQKFMGQAYAYGATKYEEDETAKIEMHELNKKIYQNSDESINALYQAGRAWSLEYFETIYTRLGTKFDEYFFESEAGKVGLEVVEEGLKKGVLEVGEEGAVVYRGEKDGMHTRVFRNKLGLPTYEAKDLGLAKTKYGRWQYDLSYIVTANEITEYFKVVLRVMEQLYPDLRAKTTHMPHGVMKLLTGKMSSRTGKVVTGEGLLNELKTVVMKKIGERNIADKEAVADMIAVGSLKYTVLKQQIGGDIVYDPDKITNLEGDTGPYLQYTYARTQSVLVKAAWNGSIQRTDPCNPEELNIIRWLYRYPETVEQAGREYAPHIVAGYLYELASRFNSFYNKHKIIGGENAAFALTMTQAVGNVLKRGLGVLGIQAPGEM